MSRVRILVEGQTEETFVNEILSPHLCQMGIYPYAFLFGGIPRYKQARKEISNSMKEDKTCFCTTMVDFYGMPTDWPGKSESLSCQNYLKKAQKVESALLEDICSKMGDSWNPAQFIPYVQMHEFEALLFSNTSILAANNSRIFGQLELILQSFSCPEEINDDYDTCPSRRIKQHIGDYVKTVDGITAAKKIGLAGMRKECPHFNEWITKLEGIGNQ